MIMAWWPAPWVDSLLFICWQHAVTRMTSGSEGRVARIWGQSHTRVEVGEAFLSISKVRRTHSIPQ